MTTPNEEPVQKSWSRLRQDAAVLLWSSFLAASVATMFFFAYFDPVLLGHDTAPSAWLADRMTAYGIGFFFFWAMCTVASALAVYLLETRSTNGRDER